MEYNNPHNLKLIFKKGQLQSIEKIICAKEEELNNI